MSNALTSWRAEKRREERAKREREERAEFRKKHPWTPPEEYYGVDHYYSILFFTLDKEKADLWRAEYNFNNSPQGKAYNRLKQLQEARAQEQANIEKQAIAQFRAQTERENKC